MLRRRNKVHSVIAVLGLLMTLTNCNRKSIELEIIETACKDFFINNAQYSFDTTGACGENLSISFDFDGDEECLFQVRVSPKFYDIDGSLLTEYDSSTVLLLKDDGDVKVSGNSATFELCIEYPSGVNPDDLSYMQVDFNTENEQTNESNLIGVRANLPGSSVRIPNSSDYKAVFNVDQQTMEIFIFDDADEDGDIISINVNNEWVIENKMILNAGEFVSVPVNVGENFILFYAVNQGTSGKNTLAGNINNDPEGKPFNIDLNTGEVTYFRVNYIP